MIRLRSGVSTVAIAVVCLVAMLFAAQAADRLRIITSGNYPPFVFTGPDGGLPASRSTSPMRSAR